MKTSRTLSAHTLSPVARRLVVALVLCAAVLTGWPAVAAESASGAGHPGVVNINTAEAGELEYLPRVGPALAQRILQYREANGEFEATEDLILVAGIGEKTFEMVRTFVVVKGETTLSRKLRTSDVPKPEED